LGKYFCWWIIFNCTKKSDATLWAWGDSYGALGDGTNINKTIPTQIGTDTKLAVYFFWFR
jgi:hypothetical protein